MDEVFDAAHSDRITIAGDTVTVDPTLPLIGGTNYMLSVPGSAITDGARNAIPGEVVIRGDTRSFSAAVQALLERRIRELVDGICAAHGATGQVSRHACERSRAAASAT